MKPFKIFLLLLITSVLTAQQEACDNLPNSVIKKQVDIDTIIHNYSDCKYLDPGFSIQEENELLDFEPLNFITGVRRFTFLAGEDSERTVLTGMDWLKYANDVQVFDYKELKSISGFNNLILGEALTPITIESTGHFTVWRNPKLESITGFNSVDTINDFSLRGNPNLKDISEAFGGHLTRVRRFVITEILNNDFKLPHIGKIEDLRLTGANKFKDLTVLQTVDTIGYINLNSKNGGNLYDIRGISDVVFTGNYHLGNRFAYIHMEGHPSLHYCHVPSICKIIDHYRRDSIILKNGTGCFSVEEVKQACENKSLCTIETDEYFILNTQAEADLFLKTYGSCRFLEAKIHIVGDLDLSGFNEMIYLNGLKITDRSVNNHGFDSLLQVHELILENNSSLNIEGLASLEFVKDTLRLSNNEYESNPKLRSLQYVGNLVLNEINNNSIDGFSSLFTINRSLTISNSEIIDLSGLEHTQLPPSIYIDDNSMLTKLSPLLDSIKTIEQLSIKNNDILSTCNHPVLCGLLARGNIEINIKNNGDGCLNKEEVINSCTVKTEDNYIVPLTIYPNPSKGIFTTSKKVESARVIDINGNAILSEVSGSSINLSNAPHGVYFLQTQDGRTVNTYKLIKL